MKLYREATNDEDLLEDIFDILENEPELAAALRDAGFEIKRNEEVCQ